MADVESDRTPAMKKNRHARQAPLKPKKASGEKSFPAINQSAAPNPWR
jgi:hypothetical protein